jgi:hypothetical protein
MNAIGKEHAEHWMIVSDKNHPVFEGGSLPNQTGRALQQLKLMEPLDGCSGR